MSKRTDRRSFIKTGAAVGAGFWAAGGVAPRESRAANEEIRFACIGIGGKGESDSTDASRAGKVVAMCDIDDARLDKKAQRLTDAKRYNDFRKMLEEMEGSIDAVTVSTPDHTHAVAAAMAMQMGKHAFCQKPLTRTIWEARRLGEIAREKNVVTQMGNQGTAESGVRQAAAMLKGGAVGDIKEVHVWTNRPVWPQGIGQPEGQEAPEGIHWEEWIGPAEMRPYSPAYHPFKWRGFWDFGTGALGDMACHTMNMAYMGCDLLNPTSVQAITSGHNKISFPAWSEIVFEFPANDWRGPVKVVWYDGGKLPSAEALEGRSKNPDGSEKKLSNSGSLIIGSEGKLFSPNDYGAEFELIGGKKVDADYTRSPGHFREFARAIQQGEQAVSNFPDYAGPLTETILLGNLAVWAADQSEQMGEKINWDAKNLEVKGTDEYDFMVKPKLHNGYDSILS
ncbi:Gfo/Idh/MocA family protein [Candidatus Laterigemmans baculatus]|uniref:Gfo/Idh/MocA family protein n=1 Tax=Candidatus Laterigemmans baculatus TaxID=2770505 RepID=UPI0013D9DC46|nr:Gfo/Idh/MocA family oxidoreductase [Candidatus Laterigemmans baculatus]